MVRTSKLATIDASRVLKRAGRLAAKERRAVAAAVSGFLADP
jgi:hypothetical protein